MSIGASGRDRSAFFADLIAAGLFVPSGVEGVYGRGGRFEEIRAAIEALIKQGKAAGPATGVARAGIGVGIH